MSEGACGGQGFRIPSGAGKMEGCEQPDISTRNQTLVLARTVCTLDPEPFFSPCVFFFHPPSFGGESCDCRFFLCSALGRAGFLEHASQVLVVSGGRIIACGLTTGEIHMHTKENKSGKVWIE